jgi:hypothetical protein
MENKKTLEISLNKRNLIWFKFKLFLIENLPNLEMFLIFMAGNKLGSFLSNKYILFNNINK